MNTCCKPPLLPRSLAATIATSLLLLWSLCSTAEPSLDNALAPHSAGNTQKLLPDAPRASAAPSKAIAPRLSQADAAQLAREHTGGQVMSVSTSQQDSQIIYGVKVLNAGHMRVVNIDANSGEILNP